MLKKFALLAALALLVSLAAPSLAQSADPLNIVCTTFPSYDWMRNILGERAGEVRLTLLQDSGIDLHNFQPTAEDFVKVSSADLFVYIGGPSDHWVEDALKEAKNEQLVAVDLMAALGDAVKQDVTVEGMQESAHAHSHDHDEHADHDHDNHDHDHDEHADHDHDDHAHQGRVHNHADEHIWLSLRNADTLVAAMADALGRVDTEHQALYQRNAQAYRAQLKALDQAYTDAISQVKEPVLLFGDRFPFRYLMDDYGITYYAAFAGCSAETEASFQTIAFLSGKVDELKLPVVLTLDGSDDRIAQAIVRTTDARDQQVLRLHAMQSLSWRDVENGMTYLSIMQDNLNTVKAALGAQP